MYSNDHLIKAFYEQRRVELVAEADTFRMLKESQPQLPTRWQQTVLWVGERIVSLGWNLQQRSGAACWQSREAL